MRSEIISAYNDFHHFMPRGSKFILFGSAAIEESPNDIDVIIVYKKSEIDPRQAFNAHNAFITAMNNQISLPLHVTMLNEVEFEESSIKMTEYYVEL